MSDLFDTPRLKVEQPRKVAPDHARYSIFNAESALVATAAESISKSRYESVRSALPGGPPIAAQTLLVSTADEVPLLTLHNDPKVRRTSLRAPDGSPIGAIRADRTTRHYSFLDPSDTVVGGMVGDLSLRRFEVSDPDGVKIAMVRKKWAGVATELLTRADRYTVDVTRQVPDPLRTLVAMSAIVIDLLIYETKDLV